MRQILFHLHFTGKYIQVYEMRHKKTLAHNYQSYFHFNGIKVAETELPIRLAR